MTLETPIFFDCQGERLLGILHRPTGQALGLGVLLVVGGPQYRIGSHRQFVLLARDLAAAGIAVFRFDYRGMGDSSGSFRDFEEISADIAAAMDVLHGECAGIRGTVLWGLCDAATANAFYAGSDDRVVGQIALNPWVRTSDGEAEAFIRHYYLKRLLSGDFWRKLMRRQVDAGGSLKDFFSKLGQSRGGGNAGGGGGDGGRDRRPLPQRLYEAQSGFQGATLLILSGQDLTAREYEDRVSASSDWSQWMASGGVEVCRLEEADHTFSRAAWRDRVSAWSREWIERLAG